MTSCTVKLNPRLETDPQVGVNILNGRLSNGSVIMLQGGMP